MRHIWYSWPPVPRKPRKSQSRFEVWGHLFVAAADEILVVLLSQPNTHHLQRAFQFEQHLDSQVMDLFTERRKDPPFQKRFQLRESASECSVPPFIWVGNSLDANKSSWVNREKRTRKENETKKKNAMDKSQLIIGRLIEHWMDIVRFFAHFKRIFAVFRLCEKKKKIITLVFWCSHYFTVLFFRRR